MKYLIGIAIGGCLAMIFPEHASEAYNFVRDYINAAARAVADQTGGRL